MKTEPSSTTHFLAEHANRSIYSCVELTLLCGASDPEQVAGIIEGRRKVPLGMVKALAAALDCNERRLMTMVLHDWFGEAVFNQIAQCFRSDERDTTEGAWIAAIRDLHDGVVPELTTHRRRLLQVLSRLSG